MCAPVWRHSLGGHAGAPLRNSNYGTTYLPLFFMKKQIVDPSREQALKVLRRTETTLSFPKLLLSEEVGASVEAERARAFVYQLVMGTLRHRGTLDWAINRVSTTPVNEFSSWIRNILRMGLFQILFLDRIPKSAAVNESVNLAKKYGHAGTAGLVNAVLRNSHREQILQAIDSLGEVSPEDLSVKYSHPQWMVQLFIDDWGLEKAVQVLRSNNEIPPLTARVNTLRISRERLLERLAEEGVRATPSLLLPEAIEFAAEGSVWKLEAYREGLLYLQDISSMLAAYSLEVEPGQTVLDACAGPGGKATHLAALMQDSGTVYALDIHDHRLSLIEKNAKRLGIHIIETRKQDATTALAADYTRMDRILTDVPCSGLGVIRRRIDLKWRLRPEQIEQLAELQSAILERAADCLRSDGLLVYSTCTISRRENEEVVTRFLERHGKDFRLDPRAPKPLEKYLYGDGFFQMLPGDENLDGFFIARLRRL